MNQTPFEFVGSHGNPRKRVNTQRIFFDHLLLKKPFLNELISRVSSQQIVNSIQAERQKDNTINRHIRISSRISKDIHNPSIYINYYLDNHRVFHVSIHLCPDCFDKHTNGPIHIIQNIPTRRVRILRVNGHPMFANTITFSLENSSQQNLDPEYKKEAEIVVDVLNAYFDPQSPLYLGEATTTNLHPNTNRIYNRIRKSVSATKTTTKTTTKRMKTQRRTRL